MNKFGKYIENYFVEKYLNGEALDSISDRQNIKLPPKIKCESTDKDLIQEHFRSRRLKWHEPYSKKRKMDYYTTHYIPFLLSLKNSIVQEKIDKHRLTIEKLKSYYFSSVDQYYHQQLEKLKLQFKELEHHPEFIKTPQSLEIYHRDIKHLEDDCLFHRLIPSIFYFYKNEDEPIIETIENLAKEFEYIYQNHKKEFIQHEIEILKIHLEVIIYTPGADYLLPARNEEKLKIRDILAVLLIEEN